MEEIKIKGNLSINLNFILTIIICVIFFCYLAAYRDIKWCYYIAIGLGVLQLGTLIFLNIRYLNKLNIIVNKQGFILGNGEVIKKEQLQEIKKYNLLNTTIKYIKDDGKIIVMTFTCNKNQLDMIKKIINWDE